MNLFKILTVCLIVTGCVPAEGRDNDITIHTHTLKCARYSGNTCIEYHVFKIIKE